MSAELITGNRIPIEMRRITDGLREGEEKYILATPSKILSVDLVRTPAREVITGETYIANRQEKRGWRRRPIEPVHGSTTRLYSEARDIMQSAADEHRIPVLHSFVTTFPSMRAWALALQGGAGIFNWDTVIDNGPGNAFNAFSTIRPKK
ncbi:MAG: hypothetical protein H0W89_03500 [Candidatus Levybacteria bacterium]|nr:hypothetical protein [Candidatus Levybacteria bacterium]